MKNNMKILVILSIFLIMEAMSSTIAVEDNAAKRNLEVVREKGKKPRF